MDTKRDLDLVRAQANEGTEPTQNFTAFLCLLLLLGVIYAAGVVLQ